MQYSQLVPGWRPAPIKPAMAAHRPARSRQAAAAITRALRRGCYTWRQLVLWCQCLICSDMARATRRFQSIDEGSSRASAGTILPHGRVGCGTRGPSPAQNCGTSLARNKVGQEHVANNRALWALTEHAAPSSCRSNAPPPWEQRRGTGNRADWRLAGQ
jgi:hypothetical protein